jgi:hypothetical protein
MIKGIGNDKGVIVVLIKKNNTGVSCGLIMDG